MLTDEEVELYRRAGHIALQVKKDVERLIKPGVSVLEICEFVERRIIELGGRPAFPCNFSINEVAAHYTALPNDELRVPENSVVKIDIGVHVQGYIADTAITISLTPRYENLVLAAKEALEKALEIIKPGIRVNEIGAVIERVAKSYGVKPVKNLGGHNLAPYTIHAGESIPNYRDFLSLWKIKNESAYAIEPFVTSGTGVVKEGNIVAIYALKKAFKVKSLKRDELKVFTYLSKKFKTLPFCIRWLHDLELPEENIISVLEKLSKRGILHKYPILVEVKKGIVAQFEDTIIIHRGEVIVTTRS